MSFLRAESLARGALAVGMLIAMLSPASESAVSAATSPELASALPTRGLPFVALGDSYAAGFGMTPTTGDPVPGCGQAASDYPHQIADALKLTLTDQTCAGATAANVGSVAQQVGTRTAPPQSRALGKNTRVVTITVGGNDLGFVDAMRSCLAVTPHGPLLSSGRLNCRSNLVAHGVDSLSKRVNDVVAGRLAAAFAAIRRAAPNAKVFVVGYPAIMPDDAHIPSTGCFRGSFVGGITSLSWKGAFPYTTTDVRYLHSVEEELDRVTASAARQAGFDYTSVLAASAAHTPCGPTPWINPITIESKNFAFSLQPGALHPNARGEKFLARAVIPKIERAFPAPPPAHTRGPSSPATPAAWSWYLSLALIILGFVGAAIVLVLRRRRPHSDD